MVHNPALTPIAYVEHSLPGRTRLRVIDRRGDRTYFSAVMQQLGAVEGVRSLRINFHTGSILLKHDIDINRIATMASDAGLFQLGPKPAVSRPKSSPRRKSYAAPSALMVASVSLAGLGVWQIARGQAFGTSVSNFWNAYGAQKNLKQPWAAAGLAGVGLLQLLRGQILDAGVSMLYYALSARKMSQQQGNADN